MTTLLHTHEGVSPMHEMIEEQAELPCPCKWAFWEALRQRINTIGGRAALDEAMRNMEGKP